MNLPATPKTPTRQLPNSSPAHHDDHAYRTALRGASLAFQRTGPSPQPSPAQNPRQNGALLAATSASRDHSLSRSPSRAQNPSRISRQTTGSSIHGGDDNARRGIEHGVSHRLEQLHANQQSGHHVSSASLLRPPARKSATDPRSTSFIAATLAVSRSGSPSPNLKPAPSPLHGHPAGAKARPMSRSGRESDDGSVINLDLTDTTSIAPMNSLISMFEKKDDYADPVKKATRLRQLTPPRAISPANKPAVSPPRPVSSMAWEKAPSLAKLSPASDRGSPKPVLAPPVQFKKPPPTPPAARASRSDMVPQTPERTNPKNTNPRAIQIPPPTGGSTIYSPQPRRAASHRIVSPSGNGWSGEPKAIITKGPPPVVKAKPQQRPQSVHTLPTLAIVEQRTARPPTPPPHRVSSAGSSHDSFVSASSAPSPEPTSPRRALLGYGNTDTELPSQRRPTSRQNNTSNSTPPKRKTPVPPPPRRGQASSTNMPLTSLTDATMAGILASSRVTPGRTAPSTPPAAASSRPSMRQTLRQPASKSDDEDERRAKDRHRKKPLQSKKKHSHHEGARRRWREEITPRERKRYEGVWASNRGLLLPTSESGASVSSQSVNGSSELVSNVVVRDIWSRSRLPIDELAEVWDLVDLHGKGVLDKTSFVVGMWLIDQRLRGRKLPQKVMESVWSSARGVRVLDPPKAKGRH